MNFTPSQRWKARPPQDVRRLPPAANLYEQVVTNNLFPSLPRRPAQIVILLGILALSAAMLAALDTVRGWRKLPVFASGLFALGVLLS